MIQRWPAETLRREGQAIECNNLHHPLNIHLHFHSPPVDCHVLSLN